MTKRFNNIEPENIQQLSPDNLVRLLKRLLQCEANLMKLNQPGILVPFQINVPDGGSDGEWRPKDDETAFKPNEFIPKKWTRYQCKAVQLTKGECIKEVVTKDKNGNYTVKPRVKEVLEAGGCYSFFSSHHEIKTSASEDINSVVRDVLQEAGFIPHCDAVIEFYGNNKIADWTNKFPAAVRFVMELTGSSSGLVYSTFDLWATRESVNGQYYPNEALTQKIKAIQESLLSDKRRLIRMTGLSGLGKSRLVFEALKPSGTGDIIQDSLSEACIFVSCERDSKDIMDLIIHLVDNKYHAIVVVDDCPPDIHDKIANVVINSQLSVITIFHEPQPYRPDTNLLELSPEETMDAVEKILTNDPELIARGEESIKAVAIFSEGFPQIAKMIVELRRAPTIEELNDRAKLFQKLLCSGKDPDDNILTVAQTLSLFHRLGGSVSKLETDLENIRAIFCHEISDNIYRRIIDNLKTRRIVQEIADTLTLSPRPLAVALATCFIRIIPTSKWKEVVNKLSEAGLLSVFQLRIQELEFSDRAEEIGKLLLEKGLPFNDAEYLLSGTGSQMFRSLTVLSPSAAIKVAKRVLGRCSLEKLYESKESRRGLVRALELLVWEPETFKDAAELLLKLAAAENEGWANNATGAFKQLFSLFLSGTKLAATKRLEVLRYALQSNEPKFRKLAIEALGAALNFKTFSRMSDTTITGKRDSNLDWKPKTESETLDYWRDCFLMLSSVILSKGADQALAKSILGKNIGVILETPLIIDMEYKIKELSQSLNNLWPEVKQQINTILEVQNNIHETQRTVLIRYKAYFTPTESDLASKVQDVVIKPGWNHRKDNDGRYIDISREESEHFASDLAAKDVDLVPFLPQLLSGVQHQAFSFGAMLGKKHSQAKDLVVECLQIWPDILPKERNPSFISGLMRGLNEDSLFRSTTLDRIASEQSLIELLVPLTASVNAVREADFVRIRNAVVDSRLDPSQLRGFIQAQPLRMLPCSFLISEFSKILDSNPQSAQILFKILFTLCHGEPERFEEFENLFRLLLLQKSMDIRDSHFGWEWHEIALKLVARTDDIDWLKLVSEFICETLVRKKTGGGNEFLSNVVSKLFEKAPAETIAPFGQVLSNADHFQRFVVSQFLGKAGSPFEDTSSPLWSIPEDHFRKWVQANRSIIPLILENISLYTVENQGEAKENMQWHPNVLTLITECTDDQQLEISLMRNINSFGSTGSRVPYLEKRLALAHQLSSLSDAARLVRIGRIIEDWLAEEIVRTRREELNQNALLH